MPKLYIILFFLKQRPFPEEDMWICPFNHKSHWILMVDYLFQYLIYVMQWQHIGIIQTDTDAAPIIWLHLKVQQSDAMVYFKGLLQAKHFFLDIKLLQNINFLKKIVILPIVICGIKIVLFCLTAL